MRKRMAVPLEDKRGSRSWWGEPSAGRGRGTVKERGEGRQRWEEPQTAGSSEEVSLAGGHRKQRSSPVSAEWLGSFLLSLMCGWESLGATAVLRGRTAGCCQTHVPQQWGLLSRSSERQLQGRYMLLFSLSMPRLNVAQLPTSHVSTNCSIS